MITKCIFTVNEFAEFARTTRDTLKYYEKAGLLMPVSRGGNNYRQYSHSQLAVVNLIHTCQALGMPLAEIKNLVDHRSPDLIYELLESKIKDVDDKIEEWNQANKLLRVLRETIQSALHVDEDTVEIRFVPPQAITLGDQNDYSDDRDDYDALFSFYKSMKQKYPDMNMNYSVWGTFSEERIKRRDWRWPDRYYFNNPDGQDKRAAGFYAVGYKRGGYGQSSDLYLRLLDYIDEYGFVVSGPTYEEYPLNEICVADDSNYLMRVMIPVKSIEQP